HNGLDYGLAPDTSIGNTHTTVLTAGETGQGYTTVPAPVIHTLHLQRIPRLPSLSKRAASPGTGSAVAASTRAPHITHIRKQPKGLRMRCLPPGFGKGKPGTIGSGSESGGAEVDGDGDLVTREAHFSKPRGPDASPQLTTKPHKRKRDAEVEMNGDTPQKSKKSKKRAEAPTSIATTNANITISAAVPEQPPVPSQINSSNAAEATMTETRPKKKKQHALQGRPKDATELLRATSPNAPPPTAPPPPSANPTMEKPKNQNPSRQPPAAPDGPKPIDPHVAASTATESAEDKARRREERRKKKERNRIRDLV
ncbi:hypothetical protein LTR28_013989, partial [Elasticomyces elasticus]